MKIENTSVRFLGFAGLCLAASSAQAVSPRAYVSVNGSDANTCNVPSTPCRTFTGAIAQVTPGGEVLVLNSGTFGGGAISQSVTINAPVGVAALAATPITVTIGASDVVTLRGISFVSPSPGVGNALTFNGAGTLNVEKCVFHGWFIGVAVAAAGKLNVTDTTVRENTRGINLYVTSGAAVASIERTRLLGNANGLVAQARAKVNIKRSLLAGNYQALVSNPVDASTTEINVERCIISHSQGFGARADSSAGIGTIRISNSTVTNNGVGLQEANLGVILSRLNNTVEGNATDVVGTIGTFTAQ